MRVTFGYRWTAMLLAAVATSGCGLKGALTMPAKSDEVVIRAPGEGVATPGDVTGTAPVTAPEKPAEETPARPKVERIPPPPLPGGNAGTSRGG